MTPHVFKTAECPLKSLKLQNSPQTFQICDLVPKYSKNYVLTPKALLSPESRFYHFKTQLSLVLTWKLSITYKCIIELL